MNGNQFVDRVARASARFTEVLNERFPAVAHEFGLTRLPEHLFKGLPCANGHDGIRYVKNGRCVGCASDRNFRWRNKP